MEPKSKEDEIAELEALIARLKADLARARKALASNGELERPRKLGDGA